jgi:hypothetical protein
MRFSKGAARFLCLGLVAFLCTSCATITIGRADSDASLGSGDDTYFVVGVQPETAAVSFFRGSIEGGTFRQNPLLPANFRGTPEDGYVVSRTHGGETLAITYIAVPNKGFPPMLLFVPCRDSRTLVFNAPGGKVIYLGDVSYYGAGGRLEASIGWNFEGAKAFMASHYPKLADKLEPQRPQFLHAVGQGSCVGG